MNYKAIRPSEKFPLIEDLWQPRVVAELNDYQFKFARIEGEFVWHEHLESDEAFLVIEGELTIEFRDGEVEMKAGDLFVVPKGVEHKPVATKECKILIIEPRGVVNTGDAGGERTAENDIWI
jgi:mannose-6-phosphate isomerase-like protein (cupin superfamily)